MAAMRIGLLLAGHVDEASRHVAGDYPELFGELLSGHDVDLVPFAVAEGQYPDHERECAGWICSPSRHSTYDDLAWISDLEEFLRLLVATETPFVGICFGHQLLAQALGGRVERAPAGWGVGVHEYEVVEPLSWFEPPGTSVALLASHQDQVTVLPPEARLWARSDFCPNAGFTLGEQAWTVQTHPEFISPLADHLLGRRVDLIGADRVSQARATLDRQLDRDRFARWMARFFMMAR